MGTVDMKYVDYLYKKQTRQNTRKSLAGDLFREIANVMGADVTLLKENRDPNRRYSFTETSVPLILEMLEMAKSREGKRLRCWDYPGAGALTIHFFINAFARLYRSNGVPENDVVDATLQMFAQTDFITIIAGIAPELRKEVDCYLFTPNGRFLNEDDGLNAADQFVFLSYLSDNPELAPEDALREYWYFHEDCVARDRQAAIPLMQAILHKQTNEEREQYKERIIKHIKLDDALDSDEEVAQVIDRLSNIAEGKGKLGDKKEIRSLVEELIERIDYHAEELDLSMDGSKEPEEKSNVNVPNINAEMVQQSHNLLCSSLFRCEELKEHRLRVPHDAENITILEMQFKDRYGFSMF